MAHEHSVSQSCDPVPGAAEIWNPASQDAQSTPADSHPSTPAPVVSTPFAHVHVGPAAIVYVAESVSESPLVSWHPIAVNVRPALIAVEVPVSPAIVVPAVHEPVPHVGATESE